MKVFNLTAQVTISIYTKVEAETLEEAMDIADSRQIKQYQWGDKDQDLESWISDEYDGTPVDIQEA